MQDLEAAKRRLCESNLTLTIAKNGEIIYENASRGISGFLEAVKELRHKLEGASVADKVAGKAVALLCVYAKVRAVYAMILSKRAKIVLEENGIYHEWDCLVENVLGSGKSGMCPFETLAAQISNPTEAYERLKALQISLREGR
jgi:hypothetical protein